MDDIEFAQRNVDRKALDVYHETRLYRKTGDCLNAKSKSTMAAAAFKLLEQQ